MLGIVNYGIGNLQSVANALAQIDCAYRIVDDPAEIAACTRLIVPGVGAFQACMAAFSGKGFPAAVAAHVAAGKPLLGICVGMQMLADMGTEFGECPGLGFIPGRVVQIPRATNDLRLPQIGWNELRVRRQSPLLDAVGRDLSAYFVHSYHFEVAETADLVADVAYGSPVTAVVQRGRIFGVQFHPEKSQNLGLRILGNFGKA